jgi:undecaprenyl-diphosphatase
MNIRNPEITWLDQARNLDMWICQLFNRANRRQQIGRFFAWVSRLGDGVFWYSLMLILPLIYGWQALLASAHMMAVGMVCLVVYKQLKARTSRPRPFLASTAIFRTVPPLDKYSFPSGHTLHAVAFTLVLFAWYPLIAWLVLPFTLLVAASRLVLGLHYPSDVLAGAGIGALIAWLSIGLI